MVRPKHRVKKRQEGVFMIRQATAEDAEAIARVQVMTWRAAYAGIMPAGFLAALSEQKHGEGWRRQLSDSQTVVFVADKNAEVIGFASGGDSRDADRRGEVEVYAIYVLPEHWGRGIGRELLAKLETALANNRGVGLWVLRDNRQAIQFYEAAGYRVDGAEKEIRVWGKRLMEVRLGKHDRP